MYIEPNSTIYILQNVPLDATYDHTIYWDVNEKIAQENYFISKKKYTLNNQSYCRENAGILKVEVATGDLFDCNYCMFRNEYYDVSTLQSHYTKWFYAFITKVEYVNNKQSRIHFQLDVMQTWHFDYTLEQCYIERQHTVTDELFENVIPENLPTGEEYVIGVTAYYDMNDTSVCALNSKQDDNNPNNIIYNEVYTGLHLQTIPLKNPNDGNYQGNYIWQMIKDLSSATGDYGNLIVHLYQCPTKFFTTVIEDEYGRHISTYHEDVNTHIPSTLGDYTPVNKKLFTYPYSCIQVSNEHGEQKILRYELFSYVNELDRTEIKFTVAGCIIPTPQALIYPLHYRGIGADYSNSVGFNDFPMCNWASDSFKAWISQNALPMAMDVGLSIAGVALGGAAGTLAPVGATTPGNMPLRQLKHAAYSYNIATQPYPNYNAAAKQAAIAEAGQAGSALMPAIDKGVSALSSIYQASKLPDEAHGNTSYSSIYAGEHLLRFSIRNLHIRESFAKIVDDYFTRYGYAIYENKMPNRNARPHWTYLKTANCVIKASFQQDDVDTIVSIYNNGITFWNSSNLHSGGTDSIGDYTQDNTPAS